MSAQLRIPVKLPKKDHRHAILGHHLNQIPFTWWITLTYPPLRRPQRQKQALRALWQWIKVWRKIQGYRVEFIAVTETKGELYHHHVLAVADVPPPTWPGRHLVKPFDSTKGASWYLGAHILRGAHIDISRNLHKLIDHKDSPETVKQATKGRLL